MRSGLRVLQPERAPYREDCVKLWRRGHAELSSPHQAGQVLRLLPYPGLPGQRVECVPQAGLHVFAGLPVNFFGGLNHQR